MVQTVQNYVGLNTPKPRSGRKSKHSELVGIEVELENVATLSKHVVFPWKTVEDHSLKLSGLEFTLLTYHNNAKTNLVELFRITKTAQASSRCSIHVHLNALDMTLENIKVFLIYYLIFEKAFYNYSGKRWNNIFCVPLHEWLTAYHFNELTNLSALTSIWEKYAGLNLLSLKQHGTIEFRQMTGNTNPVYIQNWINLIVSLKKYAVTKTYEETMATLLTLNSTSAYWYIIDQIFGNAAITLQYPNFKEDIESCISNVKLLSTPIDKLVVLNLGEIACVES